VSKVSEGEKKKNKQKSENIEFGRRGKRIQQSRGKRKENNRKDST